MDHRDLANLLYLTTITLEFILLTWTPNRPFRFNSYRPLFKSETPTFLTYANLDQYNYNLVNGRPKEKDYPKPPTNKTKKPNQYICSIVAKQDLYSGESYYEYDSDDEESEKTEEETDSKFYSQEAFHQRSFGGTQIRNYRWRTNEASQP
ncbi:hypothetical protein C2G38_2041068 [Gigaspora rosea]|uniref:Uncharacterized protein n=1 Tax=Gigaspora rosea TaxID=44941 RepID=A0A397UT71_9GLOM|nr:hypothetical protein C2G38_2041068 [Gigaspora rosea]